MGKLHRNLKIQNAMKSLNSVFAFLIICSVTLKTLKESDSIDPINQDLLSNYVKVSLNADLSELSANEKEVISLLIKASDIIDSS